LPYCAWFHYFAWIINEENLPLLYLPIYFPSYTRRIILILPNLGNQIWQPFDPHELGSSWTSIRWIRGCFSCSLGIPSISRSILVNIFWTSPFNVFLSFFVIALVIGWTRKSNLNVELILKFSCLVVLGFIILHG